MNAYAPHDYRVTLHAHDDEHAITIQAESDDYAMRSAMMWASCKLSQIDASQGHVTVRRDGRDVGSLAVRLDVGVSAQLASDSEKQ